VIVFTVIAVLAHREKVQKKRASQLQSSSFSLNSTASVNNENEKKPAMADEEAVTSVVKY
jgi:hypothetical protein